MFSSSLLDASVLYCNSSLESCDGGIEEVLWQGANTVMGRILSAKQKSEKCINGLLTFQAHQIFRMLIRLRN